ncbi:hypothetical protein P9850_01980 [Anoxybacillus rupiensis]|uniref:Uncharacterized protein n=1 Tax=Anoxybacteroides rupiense TaxID=311460 RepID=A0ABD5IQV3_9BACL|nr:hypothetical protein [Anoxybacillus rupiensis]
MIVGQKEWEAIDQRMISGLETENDLSEYADSIIEEICGKVRAYREQFGLFLVEEEIKNAKPTIVDMLRLLSTSLRAGQYPTRKPKKIKIGKVSRFFEELEKTFELTSGLKFVGENIVFSGFYGHTKLSLVSEMSYGKTSTITVDAVGGFEDPYNQVYEGKFNVEWQTSFGHSVLVRGEYRDVPSWDDLMEVEAEVVLGGEPSRNFYPTVIAIYEEVMKEEDAE